MPGSIKNRNIPKRAQIWPFLCCLVPQWDPALTGKLSYVPEGTCGHSEMRKMHRSGAGTKNRRQSPQDPHLSMDKSSFQTTVKPSLQSLSPLWAVTRP